MTSDEIKKEFLRFFENRGHKLVPSSSLVPDDPTLLLTTAGMVQFKPYFLNVRKPSYSRAASVQKCVRTTDIEHVGRTARHLTFFEMLGNFSFGDYYKQEAITWAWQLITDTYKMDPDKLWISIYLDDEEAHKIWNSEIGISDQRIVRLGEEHNFWSAGPTGPCGPCSEIHYDFGEDKKCCPDCQVGCDCDRFLEVWNLVFMEFNRSDSGSLGPLPSKNIDTGIGVERTALVLQGAQSAFDTDHLRSIVGKVEDISGIKYGQDHNQDISMKIISDHCRALTFMVSDGIMPSNEGRGYILRRLLRRAARHGRSLGIQDDFMLPVVEEVIRVMAPTYNELTDNHAFIKKIIETEEQKFSTTLHQGLSILTDECSRLIGQNIKTVPGRIAFKLYDTFGFPFEITKEIADEKGLGVDSVEFEALMEEQKERAKLGAAFTDAHAEMGKKTVFDQLSDLSEPTEFVGYSSQEVESVINAIIAGDKLVDSINAGEEALLILKATPFYGEQGGQVGDVGEITSDSGKFDVTKTITLNQYYIHHGKVSEGKLNVGHKVMAKIDPFVRQATAASHTATHILHWALRAVLGDHVKQAGSLVEPDRLRFDFSHYQALTDDELQRVEAIVNDKIFAGVQVKCYTTSFDFAKSIGALAFFGEKYAEFVRVVEAGDFSKELCGGTHATNTTEIRLFVVTHESSIASNIRRIEALTGKQALSYLQNDSKTLRDISRRLHIAPDKVTDKIEKLETELKKTQKELDSAKAGNINEGIDALIDSYTTIGPFSVITKNMPGIGISAMRDLADSIRDRLPDSIIMLGSDIEGKAMLICACGPAALKRGADANAILNSILGHIDGRGGGKKNFAQAGGTKPEGISAALESASAIISKIPDANPSA